MRHNPALIPALIPAPIIPALIPALIPGTKRSRSPKMGQRNSSLQEMVVRQIPPSNTQVFISSRIRNYINSAQRSAQSVSDRFYEENGEYLSGNDLATFINSTMHSDTPKGCYIPLTSITLTPETPPTLSEAYTREFNGKPSKAEKWIKYVLPLMQIPAEYQVLFNTRPFRGYHANYNLEGDVIIYKNNVMKVVLEINGGAHYTDGAQIFRDTLKIAQIVNMGVRFETIDVQDAAVLAKRAFMYTELENILMSNDIDFTPISRALIHEWRA
jgi:hypothetical protein